MSGTRQLAGPVAVFEYVLAELTVQLTWPRQTLQRLCNRTAGMPRVGMLPALSTYPLVALTEHTQ